LSFRASALGRERLVDIGYCHFPYIRVRTLRQALRLLSISDSGMTVGVSNRLITINFMFSYRDIRKVTVG
jgi:hypothetical protein